MSDTPQQYILRPGMKVHRVPDSEMVTINNGDAEVTEMPWGFDSAFVPLDVQALREQVRNTIFLHQPIRSNGTSWLDDATNEILSLFGLHNTEEQT